eukprot:SAG22_NODE_40_length_25739_cov_38.630031_6_plen_197_part_00
MRGAARTAPLCAQPLLGCPPATLPPHVFCMVLQGGRGQPNNSPSCVRPRPEAKKTAEYQTAQTAARISRRADRETGSVEPMSDRGCRILVANQAAHAASACQSRGVEADTALPKSVWVAACLAAEPPPAPVSAVPVCARHSEFDGIVTDAMLAYGNHGKECTGHTRMSHALASQHKRRQSTPELEHDRKIRTPGRP